MWGKGGGVEPIGFMSLVFFQYFTVYLHSVCRTIGCEGWYLPRLPDNAYLWPGWGSLSITMILAEGIGGKGGGGWSQTGISQLYVQS